MIDRIPIHHFALIVAVPLALLALAVVLNTVVAPRELVARRTGVPLASSVESVIMPTPDDYTGIGGEPLSIDATPYEKIRQTEYEVQSGDTIWGTAERFGLDPRTVMSINPMNDVRRMRPGTVLYIPNRDGMLHFVQQGESLSGIADLYGIELFALVDANDIESEILQTGDVLFIPDVMMEWEDFQEAIGELFIWPVRSYSFTSGFGMRPHPITGIWHLHTGIDLANRVGTPILAAGSGRVEHIEDQTSNYGKMLIIDHPNGYRTLYAHLDTINVVVNEYVSAGEQIGTMGNTGRSTGPHLHFSVFRGSQPIDPLRQLRQR